MILNKEVKDFKGYNAKLEVPHITKYIYLAVGIDCKYYKEI